MSDKYSEWLEECHREVFGPTNDYLRKKKNIKKETKKKTNNLIKALLVILGLVLYVLFGFNIPS